MSSLEVDVNMEMEPIFRTLQLLLERSSRRELCDADRGEICELCSAAYINQEYICEADSVFQALDVAKRSAHNEEGEGPGLRYVLQQEREAGERFGHLGVVKTDLRKEALRWKEKLEISQPDLYKECEQISIQERTDRLLAKRMSRQNPERDEEEERPAKRSRCPPLA